MAVILGAMYPELYVAVGAHSGLPYRAAHDMPSAFAAMQGGHARPGRFQRQAAPPSRRVEGSYRTPTIVFHGDNDRTVNARNGNAIVEQMTVVDSDRQPLRAEVRTGTSPGGRSYKRTDYLDHANQTVVEHWMVHGAGHAWSGGSAEGSFTDPAGPDASAEMIRFFLSQRRAGTS
jgi:poly(3-hydroxybutyrate) depolymerase